jgi:hypothetical protein
VGGEGIDVHAAVSGLLTGQHTISILHLQHCRFGGEGANMHAVAAGHGKQNITKLALADLQ